MKENTYVRTAADLERKYNLSQIQETVDMAKETIEKTNGQIEEFVNNTIGDLQNLQDQLDGKIETYYGNGIPTLENYPASEWTNYEEHISDLYYDRDTGEAYRFVNNNWEHLSSQPLQEALSVANSAMDTADSKRRVFVIPPVPPYDSGDLWLKDGELYVCQISRIDGEYQEYDFIIATDYETNTQATATRNEILSQLEVVSGRVTTIDTDTYKKTEIEKILEGTYVDANGNKIITQIVQTTSATFDETGMHYEKSGSNAKSTINEVGLQVKDLNNEETFFAGHVTDNRFGENYINDTLVYTHNLRSTGYTEVGMNGRFEEYPGPNNEDGVGFFII